MHVLLLLLAFAVGAFAGPASLTFGDEVVYERGSKQTGVSFGVDLVAYAEGDSPTGFPEGSCADRLVRIRRALARLRAAHPERVIEALDAELLRELEDAWGLSGGANDPESPDSYSWWNYALGPDGTVGCQVHPRPEARPTAPPPEP